MSESEERPSKRARLLSGPDGFSKPSSSTRKLLKPTEFSVLDKALLTTPSKPESTSKKPSSSSKRPAFHSKPDFTTPSKPSSKAKTFIFPPPTATPKPRLPDTEPPLQKTRTPKLKHLVPPAPPQQTTPSRRKPIHAAQPKLPPSSAPQNLKTINTTRMAIATDLSTEAGSSEVAGVFLAAAGLETHSDEVRGLQQSPQKGTGSGKYVRHGLAASASSMLSQLQTSLVLWESEVRSIPASRLDPDLRFVIQEITCVPLPSKSASTTGMALCYSLTPLPSKKPLGLPVKFSSSPPERESISVLLSFSSHPSPPTTMVRNPRFFKEGWEIRIWKPFKVLAVGGGDLYVCERFILHDPAG